MWTHCRGSFFAELVAELAESKVLCAHSHLRHRHSAQGKKQGPFPFARMLNWANKNAFGNPAMPIQHASLYCWVPLWFIQASAGQPTGAERGGVSMQFVHVS